MSKPAELREQTDEQLDLLLRETQAPRLFKNGTPYFDWLKKEGTLMDSRLYKK